MALLWMDGFDHYGTDTTNMSDGAWANNTVYATLSTVNPRTGTHSLRFPESSSSASPLRRVFGDAKVTAGLGSVYWLSSLPTTNDRYQLVSFKDTANVAQVTLVLQSTGILSVKRGQVSGTELGNSGTPAITAEAYTHIEILVTIDNAAGAVEVRVNGITVISLTGIDTQATSNTETSQVDIGRTGGTGSLPSSDVSVMYVDDIFCYDDIGSFNNTFIGDRKVFTLFPNADTAQADWTPLGGTGFSNIDEADPDDDTSYISTGEPGSPGAISEFALDNLPSGVSSISALVIVNRAKKTDAGIANMVSSIVSTSSESSGSLNPMTEAYTYYHDVVEVDPDTSAPFTPSAVDSALIKIERTD